MLSFYLNTDNYLTTDLLNTDLLNTDSLNTDYWILESSATIFSIAPF